MSKRTWIILGVVLGLLCLCLVIAGVVMFTQGSKLLQQSMNQDPAKTTRVAESIADFELPAQYQASYSMSLFGMNVAAFQNEAKEMNIVLFQFPENSGMTPEQMETQMRETMSGQLGPNTKLEKISQQEVVIRGQPAILTTYEGNASDGTQIKQVIGAFQGKSGTAFLMVVGNQSDWDQQGFEEFIASLR